MLTHPKSTMHVLCMLMHLSLGHVTAPRKILTPKFSPNQTCDTGWTLGGLTLGSAPNF